MRLIDRLGLAQKIVVVVALGLAFGVLGSYLGSLGNMVWGGWYAYAPLTQSLSPPRTGLAPWLRLLIWLALIGLWAVTSARVLRPRQNGPASGPGPG
jgi:hypothetical protein